MPDTGFYSEYFEDAYRDAAKARREVLDRGLLLIAHVIWDELPTATALSINGGTPTAIHDGDTQLWKFNDATRDRLSESARARVRDVLLDMLHFNRGTAGLLAADWKEVPDLIGTLRVDLPDNPDRETPAPAPADRPTGTPGEDAGPCAQCQRLLIWDRTGKRVNDEWGEYICSGPRPGGTASAIHVLAAPETAPEDQEDQAAHAHARPSGRDLATHPMEDPDHDCATCNGDHRPVVPPMVGIAPYCACGWTPHRGVTVHDHLKEMGAWPPAPVEESPRGHSATRA
ncbi:hypothetical protein AQJ30_15545 [Streptomyces longwoodensis]|uniref:Uncharacterized protein n=1 Tax=Streptomyces longwoodensis TaxID=68231 RepID=A0A101QXD0_9ACTN|nr:hypothetical protein [Streptomyces longwoodensis]KUN37697.1 hypothetical protein AQJ30_15545 [Streptomyces longwoodensis]